MASKNSEKRQNDAKLFWENVRRLKRDCLSGNQTQRPLSDGDRTFAALSFIAGGENQEDKAVV